MDIAITLLGALTLDHLLGEAKRWHPLVGFGNLALVIEAHFNITPSSHSIQKILGILSLVLLLVPFTVVTAHLSNNYNPYLLFDAVVLYFALGANSLVAHAQRVANALLLQRTEKARKLTGFLVSRDTDKMTETDMSRATIESTLENGNDAIFAPIFWYVVGGAPAVLLYRLSNTLDAMWGYKTPQFFYFGWASARMDDLLNYIPARLTALTYACLGRFQTAIHCWHTQASLCKSPNGGPVMASGAGALALQLGGPTSYHGKLEQCPILGCGEPPVASDIMQATNLIRKGIILWITLIFLFFGGLSLA